MSPAPSAAPSQAVIRLSPEAKRRFPPALVSTISGTVGQVAVKAHDIHLLTRFIELAAALDLNPLTGEIWLAQMRGRNGGEGRLAIMVGRDGYMTVARRHDDFIDVDADVVYANDTYAVVRKEDGSRTVAHSYGHPSKRGEPVGAYAVLRRVGKPDRYFYAPLAQYAKDREKSAWSYLDGMIIKCATSYILRTTYGVSGPVPFDELGAGLDLPGSGDGPGAADVGDFQPLDPQIAGLYERIRELDPMAFGEGEMRARSQGATPVQMTSLVYELEQWLVAHEPPEAEVVEPASDSATSDEGTDSGEYAEADVPVEEVDGVEVELPPLRDPEWLAADERWTQDMQWRAALTTFLDRIEMLERQRDEGMDNPDLTAELNWLDERLVTFKAPLGWRPPADEL